VDTPWCWSINKSHDDSTPQADCGLAEDVMSGIIAAGLGVMDEDWCIDQNGYTSLRHIV